MLKKKKSLLIEFNYSQTPQGVKGIILVSAVLGFGRSVRIFLEDAQGFHRFMATDLEHEDVVETAIFGPENNLIVTGSRDALIQVRGRCMAHRPHLHLWKRKYDSFSKQKYLFIWLFQVLVAICGIL